MKKIGKVLHREQFVFIEIQTKLSNSETGQS